VIRKKQQSAKLADEWANCTACLRDIDRRTRANWACGFLPQSERSLYPLQCETAAPRATVCVGYTTSLPTVVEMARAHAWFETGQLREFFDGDPIPDVAKHYIDVFACELRREQAHAMEPKKGGSHG